MPHFDDSCYKTHSAVLFIIFNRPDTTNRVFHEIRKAKPPRLYIAADAARIERVEDILLCEQAREVVSKVDWNCNVKTLFQENNLGCRKGVPTAIDWFFKQEEKGIILEDDCLPANSFFKFCDVLLEHYRCDDRVRHITGCNLHFGKKWGEYSYYFSKRSHVWGWASWKRVWDDYDGSLEKYNPKIVADKIQYIFKNHFITDCWTHIFKEVKSGKINTWAYQLDFANFFKNGLCIIPNQNLISNIGFRKDATHTFDERSPYANIPVLELNEITHPFMVTPQKEADQTIFYRDFKIAEKEEKRRFVRDRIKKWYTGCFHNT